ncbi:oligosaccharide flippase family protein [Photobacterium damselae]|uniref:oligosaccharide flippase family protein n=1 Tax=Photobacterium damselae TaxID=38293 RepID=UPI0025433CA9
MIKALFYSIEKYLNTFLLAVFGFILADKISIDDYGLYSNSEAIAGILSIFALSGLDQITQRELVRKEFRKDEILYTSLIIKILSIVIASFAIILILPDIYKNKELLLLVYIISISMFLKGFLFLSSYLICDDEYKLYTYIGVMASLISFIIKIFVLYYFNSIYYIAICLSIEPVILILFYTRFIIKSCKLTLNISTKLLRLYWIEGRFLIFSGAMILVYTRVDQVMIGQLLSKEDLANYSLSLKVLTLFIIISTVFNLKFIPSLKKDCVRKYIVYKEMLVLTFLFSIILSIINYYMSPFIIEFFYQNKFSDAIEYIKYLTPIICLTFLLSTTGRILVTENLAKIAFERNLCAFILNIILNLLLIRYLGVKGAIIASIVSYLTSSFIYLLLKKETRKIFRDICNEL